MYAHVYVHMCMYNTYIPHPNSYHGVTNCNAQFAPLPTHASTRPGQDDGSGTWSHFSPPAAAAPLGAGPRPRRLTNVGCASLQDPARGGGPFINTGLSGIPGTNPPRACRNPT